VSNSPVQLAPVYERVFKPERQPLNDDQRRATGLFLHSLKQLTIDDDRLRPGHDLEDLNAIAFLAGVVKVPA
jgi:hypothetical protein